MASSKPKADSFLKSTSTVSLHERFSQVLLDQLTRPRMVTFDPVSDSLPVVLLVKKEPSSLLTLQAPCFGVKRPPRRRRSVWTRLGWQRVTRRLSAPRPRGFWSFTNKYRWRAGFTRTDRRRGRLRLRRRFLRKKSSQKLTAGPHLNRPKGGATAQRGRGLSKDEVPTRRQLDAQLDEYMSTSKRQLDAQLDEYMSTSRRQLDAELDEYMSMAGETQLPWD